MNYKNNFMQLNLNQRKTLYPSYDDIEKFFLNVYAEFEKCTNRLRRMQKWYLFWEKEKKLPILEPGAFLCR